MPRRRAARLTLPAHEFEGGFDVAALPGGERRVEIDAGGGLQVFQGGLHALFVVVLDHGAATAAVDLVGSVEFGQQLVRRDGLPGMAGGQADDDVAQLAHVAGETVAQPQRLARRVERERLAMGLRGIQPAEMVEQQQAVAAHVAQRGDADREYREPVVEIGAEAAGLDFLAQVAIGGGDDARPGSPRLGLADPLVLAVFQHAQQLGLEVGRQFADFVEEQRAFAGFLEIAGTGGRGAGEGAPGMTEERRFEQAGRDRRAVERQKRLLLPFGHLVQAAAGDDVLAAAGFAFDEDREAEVRVLGELQAQALHRQAVADQASFAGRRGRAVREGQRLAQQGQQVAGVAGFADEFHGAQRARMAGIVIAVLAGEDDDLHLRRVGQQFADQGETFVRTVRLRRQPEVDQRRLRRLAQLPEQRQAVRAGMAGNDVEFRREGMAQ